MNTRPIMIASIIGIFVLSVAATLYLGVRAVSKISSGAGLLGLFGGGGYYGVNSVANSRAQQGDAAGAIAEYDKMVAMRPNKVDGYLLRAMEEFRIREFRRSIQDDTTALNLLQTRAGIMELGFNPNASYQQKLKDVPMEQASLYYNRAIAYDSLHDLTHAVADYTADLAIRPHESDARENRAIAYLGLKQYAAGIADCSYSIGRHPERSANYDTRGQIYAAQGDVAHAEQDFNKAIQMTPDDLTLYRPLSLLYEKNKQFARNTALWKSATEALPDRSLSWGGYGWALYESGDFADSIANSQKAIQMDPGAGYAKCNLALCYVVTDRWDQAEPIYSEVIRQRDGRALPGALADVRDALKTHPNSQALRKAEALLSAS